MRTFIAAPIPPDTEARIIDLGREIGSRLPSASWARRNIHLTLAFTGEMSGEAIARLSNELDEVGAQEQIQARVVASGFFPGDRRPRVAWLGLEPEGELRGVADAVRVILDRVGIAYDRKRFVPHLTVARLRQPWSEAERAMFRRSFEPLHGAVVRISEVVLFGSVLSPSGAAHTRIATIPLAVSRPA